MNNINTIYFFETLSLSGDFSLTRSIFFYVFSLFDYQENVRKKLLKFAILNLIPNYAFYKGFFSKPGFFFSFFNFEWVKCILISPWMIKILGLSSLSSIMIIYISNSYYTIYNIFNIYGISTKWEREKKTLERRRREYNENEDGVRANEVYLLTINEEKLRMYKS